MYTNFKYADCILILKYVEILMLVCIRHIKLKKTSVARINDKFNSAN